MNNGKIAIEMIAVTQLTPYSNNSKIHTKSQIKHIANSIKDFGFNDPLAVVGENNVVLEGNGRIEAAKSLGINELPCIRLDHLDVEQQQAYVIAHNSLCLETGFDDATLMSELEKLQNFDFSDYGLEVEKYITTLEHLQKKELKPITKAHYLISVDVNFHDKTVKFIDKLRNIEGVEVRATCN